VIKYRPLYFQVGLRRSFIKRKLKGGEAPSTTILPSLEQLVPLPLVKGKGIQGIGLLKFKVVRFNG
jgi:hypothetical protein